MNNIGGGGGDQQQYDFSYVHESFLERENSIIEILEQKEEMGQSQINLETAEGIESLMKYYGLIYR